MDNKQNIMQWFNALDPKKKIEIAAVSYYAKDNIINTNNINDQYVKLNENYALLQNKCTTMLSQIQSYEKINDEFEKLKEAYRRLNDFHKQVKDNHLNILKAKDEQYELLKTNYDILSNRESKPESNEKIDRLTYMVISIQEKLDTLLSREVPIKVIESNFTSAPIRESKTIQTDNNFETKLGSIEASQVDINPIDFTKNNIENSFPKQTEINFFPNGFSSSKEQPLGGSTNILQTETEPDVWISSTIQDLELPCTTEGLLHKIASLSTVVTEMNPQYLGDSLSHYKYIIFASTDFSLEVNDSTLHVFINNKEQLYILLNIIYALNAMGDNVEPSEKHVVNKIEAEDNMTYYKDLCISLIKKDMASDKVVTKKSLCSGLLAYGIDDNKASDIIKKLDGIRTLKSLATKGTTV